MCYRAPVFASALIAAPVSAATVHTFTGTDVAIDWSDKTLPPIFWFVIDTPGAEVYSDLEDLNGDFWNIFHDPIETLVPQSEGVHVGDMWGVNIVTAYFGATEPFTMRWFRSHSEYATLEDFIDSTPIAHAPIPAALPMLLAALAGLGLLGGRRRRA